VDTKISGPSPTAREREVARMIGLGLTNRDIATQLGISERTVGAHVQNILNKLGATNRAQIATWSAQTMAPAPKADAPEPAAPQPSKPSAAAESKRVPVFQRMNQFAILIAGGLILSAVFPADHQIEPATAAAALSSQRGDLVFEAKFDPDGREFSLRYVIGDPDASSIRFVNDGLEYSVLKSGGNTGNRLALNAMPAYFAEYEISVQRNSNVMFWISFSTDDPSRYGVHLLSLETGIEAMQLAYFTGDAQAPLPLGPQVSIDGLLTGRRFSISTLVAPPVYRVFLDGAPVIDVRHESIRRMQSPNFGVFGEGGTVRLSALRIYKIS
jgi:DNA-binding CsgD family transcriptional regulator